MLEHEAYDTTEMTRKNKQRERYEWNVSHIIFMYIIQYSKSYVNFFNVYIPSKNHTDDEFKNKKSKNTRRKKVFKMDDDNGMKKKNNVQDECE